MESLDSSPNYMRATTSFHAKKETSQVGNECVGIISLTSSSTTCGSSSVNGGPHTPKLDTKNPKKTFKNIKSFRKRAKSRTSTRRSPVVATPDEGSVFDPSESSSSPSYLKSTSCSQGKKTVSSRSLSRAPSSKSMRILLKKASFKPKRGSSSYSKASDDVAVANRATHSSTLKGSKFLEKEETEESKICRYHHCSLHGGCSGAHDSASSQTKRFLYNRRRSLRRQKSRFRENEKISISERVDREENKTSFPERSYNENVEMFGKYSTPLGQQPHCPTCTCRAHETANNEDGGSKTVDSKLTEVVKVNDSETNSPTQEVEEHLRFSEPRHVSMWNLIHERMASNLSAAEGESPVDGGESSSLAREVENSDSENREIEQRKMLAVKLVKEAIEKILLAEVQDQSSDDQSSVSSESTPRAEENRAESAEPKQESPVIDDKASKMKTIGKWFGKKSDNNKAPKHWSNLKKWILLQRFIRELEKVKKFDPKKPQLLPLNPDPEAEKVNLRHLEADGKKNSEEWMLDYALRQAVGQLGPTQKKKVSLLVRAFETVAPIKEDELPPQDQNRIPRLKPDESGFPANQESGDYGESSKKFQESSISSLVEGNMEESGQKNHIKMWHMIYQHVVSGIAEKVGSRLLDGSEDDEEAEEDKLDNNVSPKTKSQGSSGFTKLDALRLVKEAVDEILLPEAQEDSPERPEVPKAKNWSKLKRLMLLKKSIRALEKARKPVEPREPDQLVPQLTDRETEKVELKRQMMDEKKKAEQWMLDYAVQHIVTKLTPDRKRRVCMLVEAFEAVVPLPGM